MGQGQLLAWRCVGALCYLHLIKVRLQLRLLLEEEPFLLEPKMTISTEESNEAALYTRELGKFHDKKMELTVSLLWCKNI